MDSTSRSVARSAAEEASSPDQLDRIAGAGGRPKPTLPNMRRYSVVHLNASANITEFARTAPALPVFEDAFAALGHGAIVQTKDGPVAVQDLLPGDRVQTASGAFKTLMWRGTITIMPNANDDRSEMDTLTRITADAFGAHRPTHDLVLGPSARLYHKSAGVRTLTGSEAAFIPARDFIDGNQLIELRPMAPVQVYQIGFEKHERFAVNGIEVDSLHPGTAHALGLRGDMLNVYLSLFPHKRGVGDFGAMQHPRLRLRDLDLFDVA